MPPAPAPVLDPLTAPLELLTRPATPDAPALAAAAASAAGWPCESCQSTNSFDATTCAACGAGFLDSVRLSEPPLLAVPLVGDLARLDKLQLLGLAFAGAVVAVLVTVLLGVLLG